MGGNCQGKLNRLGFVPGVGGGNLSRWEACKGELSGHGMSDFVDQSKLFCEYEGFPMCLNKLENRST